MGEKLYKLFGLIGSLRLPVTLQPGSVANVWELIRAGKEPSRSLKFYNHEEGPSLSWLKVATIDFTFKNLLRHNAKQALTQGKYDVKLGRRIKDH